MMLDKYIRSESNQGAVINTDNEALRQYKILKLKNRELEGLKTDVREIKDNIATLTELLLKTHGNSK
jgi:hypothetical protein